MRYSLLETSGPKTSVKDIAKNMDFGFLGQSRDTVIAEKKRKEEEERIRRRELEEAEFERRE